MDSGRYFYSVNGSAVLGPVGADSIRRLCEQRILSASSLICPEGATSWETLVPEAFAPSLARERRAPNRTVQPVREIAKPRRREQKEISVGMGRLSYLGWTILLVVVKIVATLYLGPRLYSEKPLEYLALIAISIVVGFALAGERLDNIGRSRWLCLLFFVPVANLALALYLLFTPSGSVGGEGKFRFGFVFFTVLIVVLVLAGGVSLAFYLNGSWHTR